MEVLFVLYLEGLKFLAEDNAASVQLSDFIGVKIISFSCLV